MLTKRHLIRFIAFILFCVLAVVITKATVDIMPLLLESPLALVEVPVAVFSVLLTWMIPLVPVLATIRERRALG